MRIFTFATIKCIIKYEKGGVREYVNNTQKVKSSQMRKKKHQK